MGVWGDMRREGRKRESQGLVTKLMIPLFRVSVHSLAPFTHSVASH